jgi:hypothetical protein
MEQDANFKEKKLKYFDLQQGECAETFLQELV